ncbi:PepSY-associated TM helix domain-containing protein [Tautonia sociabilis]|uniref:Peptidase n=1 Tax=Tautonia sociabilis TaxID=2080755 RepID=A0A432MK69_9BACT|nr:PepSY-associated TM helix domain-containing protein [Tautonia sociabilis]RUL87803.1 peptidase [Tautonia sociabilis]
MSRSSPPPSNTGERPTIEPASSVAPAPARARARGRGPGRTLGIRVAAFFRWLHIYLSMFGLASVLFFSVTGLTLNHPDWFYGTAERIEEAEGRIDLDWLHRDVPDGSPEEDRVDRLRVVEFLRAEHGVGGALTEFSVDEYECFVTFKGPGYSADAQIDRETGSYVLTETALGPVAVLNDLHKGRDTGPVWSLAIDVSAVVLTVISLSGLVLLLYLKLRRSPGLAVALVGGAVVVGVVLMGVP